MRRQLEQILGLQPRYSVNATPAMQERQDHVGALKQRLSDLVEDETLGTPTISELVVQTGGVRGSYACGVSKLDHSADLRVRQVRRSVPQIEL
jgi:hypothetical protein